MRQSPHRQRLLAGLAVLAATAAMLLIPAQQATAKADPGCAAGGVKVVAGASPATVSVNDTTTSTGVQVVVSITGTTFAVTPVDSGVTLTSATWCLKASTKTQNGTGTTGTSTITNGKGVAQEIGYLVVYDVTSQAPEPVVDQENAFLGGSESAACPSTTFVQTFTAGRTGPLVQVTLYATRTAGSGPLEVSIYQNGPPALSQTLYSGADSPDPSTGFDVPLSQSVSLTQGTQYTIAWRPTCDVSGTNVWQSYGGAEYAGGQGYLIVDALPQAGAVSDYAFKTWMTN